MVGDAKPIAFVEDTAVDPERLPAFYERFQRDRRRGTGVRAACYGHADVGCLHIRPIINVKTARGGRAGPVDRARGLRPGRRVRRRDERRARRRPGPQPLERQAVRPRGLRLLRGRQAGLRPRQPAQPRQGRRRARPGRQPPDRPRLPRRRAGADRPRLLEPGGVRPRRRDVLGRRRLPQDGRRARCARATWSPATRSTPPGAAPTPSAW